MTNRHLARSVVLQALFELSFSDRTVAELPSLLHRIADEFAPGTGDFAFMEDLARGVMAKRSDLDVIIEKAAPEWPLEKIALVDLTVLRIGLYELLFGDRKHVPAKVAINEAIELAKSFGGDSSGKFVNGVLGSVYKEMGEPGKEESSKRKNIPYDDLPLERLGGAVVYAMSEGEVYVALVHDVFGHWTLSKGKIAPGEELNEGIIRGIGEELGIEVTLEEELGSNEYVASHPERGKIRKNVTYRLARAPFRDLTLGTSGGLDDARWFKLSEIIGLNIYDDILPLITKAINLLVQKK